MRLRRRSFLTLGAAGLAACAARLPHSTVTSSRVGVATAFIRRGEPDVLHGQADLTPDTLLEVASLSKPVFAYAVVAEAARGAIDLDAPLARIGPPPYPHVRRGAVDRFADPRLASVTPRLLLAHRAGFPNWSRDHPLAFADPPGGAWRYSGEGYVLLQRALETRESLDAFTRRAALAPLGMRRSTYDPASAQGRAEGHDRSGKGSPSSLDAPIAATSLVSCAAEYARFVRRLAEAPAGDAIVEAMLTRQIGVDAERRLAWGLGVALAEPEWFFHWGANPGFRSLFVGSRGRGEAIVVLTSSEAGMEVAANVVREHFGDLALLTFPMLYPPD